MAGDRAVLSAGVDALASRYALDREQVDALVGFGMRLAHDPLAPTTVREPRAIVNDHLADSLVAVELAEVSALPGGGVIADLGTGAGVPGIPLAIALPAAQVLLVEANERKCEFMRSVVGELGLTNAEVVWGRAETWQDGLGRCEVVTARALASLDVIEEYAAPLLRIGGALIAWRGRVEPDAEADARYAAELLGLELRPPLAVSPYARAEHRHLCLAVKVSETPSRFPRRDGVARKRPLGAARPRSSIA